MTENEALEILKLSPKMKNQLPNLAEVYEVAVKSLEKQIPKKPILCMNETTGMFVDYADGQGEYKTQMNNWWKCPCCKSIVGERILIHKKRVNDQRKKKFCENCGQKIEW